MRAVVLVTLVCLMAALGGAVGTQTPPPDLEVLWEFPYEYELVVSALRSNGGYRTQDDFIFENSGVVKGFECWFCYDGNHPKPYEGTIFYDHNGWPGSRYWIADITDVTDTDTGDDWYDFDVYRTTLLLDEEDYVFIEAGELLWLELYWDGLLNGYWLCALGGNAHCNHHEYNLSTFFTILGTPSEEGVESASWGEIKASF
jgi:hypothetical protein